MSRPNQHFWRGKRVLITGHTGFKGGWLAIWLHRLGAKIIGISLPPTTLPNLYTVAHVEALCEKSHFCDIREAQLLTPLIHNADPDILIHLAAQPLVRASYREPVTTFDTNVMGAIHVLESLRGITATKVAVMVTTDKVYQNREWLWPYREDDTLGGHDPYSASKAACEIAIASYRDSFLHEKGVAVASARAGNVIGGGDWSEDRLIPDAVRAWQSGAMLQIRHPEAIRPWQHVLEPLAGYLALAETLYNFPKKAGAYNFGPETRDLATVRAVIELARSTYDKTHVDYGAATQGPHEAGLLTLEIVKARKTLGHSPCWGLQETVDRTMKWYRAHRSGVDARSLCEADLVDYELDLEKFGESPPYRE